MVIEAFNDDSGRLGRALTWITHRSGYALVAYIVVCVPNMFYKPWWLEDLAIGIAVLFNVAFLTALLHVTYTRLCVSCMAEVPENASERAHRYRWLLRFEHLRAWQMVTLFLFLAYVPGLLLPFAPGAVSAFSRTPMDLWIVVFLIATRLHHRYRPWCPWCKDWGEGGDIHEPSPDPVGQNTLTR